MHGRSPRRRLIRHNRRCVPALLVSALLALTATGCDSASRNPAPTPSAHSPRPTPTPSNDPKPGGTLRIVGVARTVDLDPASPVNEQEAPTGLAAVSAADGNRLVGRLILRQLYGYQPSDPTADDTAAASANVPVPDLAGSAPTLSDAGRTATITLRPARWDVPSSRRVTATDELRALKRLCLPSISSPVRGYLAESVVGYAAACSALAVSPPRTIADLDAVSIPGLSIEGDTTLVIKLLQPTNDLTAILSLPQTSPLPVESFNGLQVINDPSRFVGDGPYRFVDAEQGERYALSRSPSWDPAGDPLRRAYVDHISIRGGLSAAQVQKLVTTGGADLSLDVPASSSDVSTEDADAWVSTPARAEVMLAVGLGGPAAVRLAVTGVRRVLAACIDAATRTRVADALGRGLATSVDELFTGLTLEPRGQPSPSPSPLASPLSASASAEASAAPSSPVASGSPSPAPAAARCTPTFGVTGAKLSMLTLDTPETRAASSVVAARLAVAGVRVTVRVAAAEHYQLLSRRGGWDLLLTARALSYPAPRALLAPLLDTGWPGADVVRVALSRTYATQMLTAAAETEKVAAAKAWDALSSRLDRSAVLLPLAQLSGVYPRGPNVAHAPTVPTFSNADPTNVALGSTRPVEPARSPTPTP